MEELQLVARLINILNKINDPLACDFDISYGVRVLEKAKQHLENIKQDDNVKTNEDITVIISGGRCNIVKDNTSKRYYLQRTSGSQKLFNPAFRIVDLILTWIEIELNLDYDEFPKEEE